MSGRGRHLKSKAHRGTSDPVDHHLALYERELAPGLFSSSVERRYESLVYRARLTVFHSGHCLCVMTHRGALCEAVVPVKLPLPATGLIAELGCSGERNFDHEVPELGLHYSVELTGERLGRADFQQVCFDLLSAAEDENAVVVRGTPGTMGDSVSVVEVARFSGEIHATAVHADATSGTVLRTVTLVRVV
jgi:hypothetical protein